MSRERVNEEIRRIEDRDCYLSHDLSFTEREEVKQEMFQCSSCGRWRSKSYRASFFSDTCDYCGDN